MLPVVRTASSIQDYQNARRVLRFHQVVHLEPQSASRKSSSDGKAPMLRACLTPRTMASAVTPAAPIVVLLSDAADHDARPPS